MSAKYAEVDNVHGYPPAYGYLLHQDPAPTAPFADTDYMLRPYTVEIGIHDATDVYQVGRYAFQGHDLDGDDVLSYFEYQPVGEKNPATGVYQWSATLYTGCQYPADSRWP